MWYLIVSIRDLCSLTYIVLTLHLNILQSFCFNNGTFSSLLKTDCDFNLGLDSVCFFCRESLFSTSYSLTISSSLCKTVSMIDKHLSAIKIAESSAYNNKLLLKAPDISLTYIKKGVPVLIPGEHHMKYLHVRIGFQIHPLAVDDQKNRTKTIWIRLD